MSEVPSYPYALYVADRRLRLERKRALREAERGPAAEQ
jgi:hypothetical protein